LDIAMPRFLMQLVLGAALSSLALSACNRERPPEDATMPAAQPPPATTPAPAVTPAPASPPAAPVGLARFDGYGDMRFGMTAAEATKAWGGDLNGKPGTGEICYYLNPVSNPSPAYFAFMIEADKFVRYDVGNDKEVAPGGGKVGMDADQIRKLYPGRIEEKPHKYVEGGHDLGIKADDDSGGVLVFETDAAGKVTSWHAGLPPQVDYIEGCS
jgi:hypothetical protein